MPINAERLAKLREFGLTEYQARVYLALLDLGEATAGQVPSQARVPRTRIYSTVTQLHEKGLVEIIPEYPMKYRPITLSRYMENLANSLRDQARNLEGQKEGLAQEFSIRAPTRAERHGRFEAIYGRRNVRERLSKMYDGAKAEIIYIGTSQSPGRIVKSRFWWIQQKVKEGVRLRYAFPLTLENLQDAEKLATLAEVRAIKIDLPVYFLVVDKGQVLFVHPIPNDPNFLRGDDIAIWTDDGGIVGAMEAIAENIYASGEGSQEPGFAHPAITTITESAEILRIDPGRLFAKIGEAMGEELASQFRGTNLPEVLRELDFHWSSHRLGRVRLTTRHPHTIQLSAGAIPKGVGDIGKAYCDFLFHVLHAVLEKKLALQSEFVDIKRNKDGGYTSRVRVQSVTRALERKGHGRPGKVRR